MSLLLPFLLRWLLEYGYPLLWVVVFIAAAGLPLPITLLLLAAGASASFGHFNLWLLLLVSVTASSSGDSVGYWIGRRWGSRVLDWLETPRRHHIIPPKNVEQARLYFRNRGAWAVFLSRSLFSALGGTINLLAGADQFPYSRFLVYDISGETLGAAIPLTVGYLGGEGWQTAGKTLGVIYLVLSISIICVLLVIQLLTHRIKMNESK